MRNTNHISRAIWILFSAILSLVSFLAAGDISHASPKSAIPQSFSSPNEPLITSHREISAGTVFTRSVYIPYLPFQKTADDLYQDLPIWSHQGNPNPHEVSLFRLNFGLDEFLNQAEIHIFADTRYEVWIDGVWVGRGPARFSRQTQEYDILPIGTLEEGIHLVAVLVQWAPNKRRSESITPYLRAHIRGLTDHGVRTLASTWTHWKTERSEAWQSASAPVHAWNLIGPTELLDLRKLPINWNQPGFDDSSWSQAVVKDITAANYILQPIPNPNLQDKQAPYIWQEFPYQGPQEPNYQPRSIPILEIKAIPATLIASGSISPGRMIGEIVPPAPDPYPISVTAFAQNLFSIEVVAPDGNHLPAVIQLDGEDLIWQELGPSRPDVFRAGRTIEPGPHTLSVANIPMEGVTIALSTQNVAIDGLIFEQSHHAGRRNLLAELVNQTNLVFPSHGETSDLQLTELPAYAVLDLGRTVHGRLTADAIAPSGTILDIGWDERVLTDTLRPLPYPGSLHPQWNQVDSWIMDGYLRPITTVDNRAGRYILITAWGDGPVHLQNIRVEEEKYPATFQAEFRSSDTLMDRIWEVGIDTMQSNLTDAFADPWRERGQWWADAFIIDQIFQMTSLDTQLLRRGLMFMEEAITNGRPTALAPNGLGNHSLDYGMLWVYSLYQYYEDTSNQAFIYSSYPSLQAFLTLLSSYENPNTGLLDFPAAHWAETVRIDAPSYYDRLGQSTAANTMYYQTLKQAANLAAIVGDPIQASLWEQKSSHIKNQINDLLYSTNQHRYSAGLFNGDASPPTPHAQAWALANGIVPENEVDAVINSLLNLLSSDPANPNLEIYAMFWVLKALGDNGHYTEAISLIENYYGHMLALGATTWWETFNSHRSFRSSLSHGWGGSPTWFLTTFILGTRRQGPNRWSIEPSLAGVTHAAGKLPLQSGVLEASWARQSCQQFTITLNSPPGTTGEVVLPDHLQPTSMTLNGQIIWDKHVLWEPDVWESAGEIHIEIGEGSFYLTINTEC